MDEVKYLKAASCTDFDRISGLYGLIDESIDRNENGDIGLMRLEHLFPSGPKHHFLANVITG